MLCPLPRMRFGDVYNGMTEQERAAALVARSRRMSRHRRRRTQRSGSGVSGTSVADSVGSRRGSIWAAVFTFNPYLLISINELLISINELLISINELLISIIHLLISINRTEVAIFIDINK